MIRQATQALKTVSFQGLRGRGAGGANPLFLLYKLKSLKADQAISN
jgi:hypothetical protein